MFCRFAVVLSLLAGCVPAHAATIVFSGAADLGNTSGFSLSGNYTVGSGQNRALVVCILGSNVSVIGYSATYNGVSLTGPVATDVTQGMQLFYLLNPASGTNSLVVSQNNASPQFIQVIAADYSNVAQTGQPDGTGTADDTGNNDTFSGAFSTTNTGATVIGCASNTGNGTAPTVSGSFTLRTYAAQFGDTVLADDGPVVPAGSVTFTATIHNGGFMQGQSFLSLLSAPSALRSLMHVGQ